MAKQRSVVEKQPAERPIVLAVFCRSLTKELGEVVNIEDVLLGKEQDGIWRFPGGKLQPKELQKFLSSNDKIEKRKIVLRALRREIGEEIDYIDIQDIHYFTKVSGMGLQSGLPVTAYVYIVHPEGDVSIPSSSTEFVELKWIDDPDMLNCQKKGESISPLACKILRLLRTQGIH